MSSNQQSYNYASYSSSTYSSSTTDHSGQTYTQRYTEESHSNDRDGTNIRRTHEETGRPTVEECTNIPAGGSRQVEGGTTCVQGRIEEVTDDNDKNEAEVDRMYRERMEDEYAKREGGA